MSMFSQAALRRARTGSLAEQVATPALTPEAKPPAERAVPMAEVAPAVEAEGWWPTTKELLVFLSGTEVHTYAFSVAANVIFSLFPFIVLILTITQKIFHSPTQVTAMLDATRGMLEALLPVGGSFVYRNMAVLVHPHRAVQLFSVFMLLITSTGVFLPLEVALNEVWGVKKHRNYLQNQVVSLGLAAAVGLLVLLSVAGTAGQHTLMTWVFWGHDDWAIFQWIARGALEIFAIVAGILIFFLIYWILPNRRIPAMAVLPTSVVVGLSWEVAKYIYILLLPKLDFGAVYGPFATIVGLMMWAFISGLILLAGAHFSATRYTLQLAREGVRESAAKE